MAASAPCHQRAHAISLEVFFSWRCAFWVGHFQASHIALASWLKEKGHEGDSGNQSVIGEPFSCYSHLFICTEHISRLL